MAVGIGHAVLDCGRASLWLLLAGLGQAVRAASVAFLVVLGVLTRGPLPAAGAVALLGGCMDVLGTNLALLGNSPLACPVEMPGPMPAPAPGSGEYMILLTLLLSKVQTRPVMESPRGSGSDPADGFPVRRDHSPVHHSERVTAWTDA